MRVSYRGREDGWVLSANKRGPTLSPTEGNDASSAAEFEAQEAAFAEAAAVAAAATEAQNVDERPLTGAKPAALDAAGDRPPPGGGGGDGDERPLGGGKGAWVPPSEFPTGHEEDDTAGLAEPNMSGGEAGGSIGAEEGEERFMTALG